MPAHTFQQYSAQNLAEFKQTFLAAIDQEREAGRIGTIRANALRRLAESPRRLNRLANDICEECCASGLDLRGPDGHTAPDWAALIDFIKQLLPIIALFFQM